MRTFLSTNRRSFSHHTDSATARLGLGLYGESLILAARHRDDFGTLRDSDSPISFITCPSGHAAGSIPPLGPTYHLSKTPFYP